MRSMKTTLSLALGLLVLGCMPVSVDAGEYVQGVVRQVFTPQELREIRNGSQYRGKVIEVDMSIIVHGQEIAHAVAKMFLGSTPADVLEATLDVKRGFVCTHPDEIWAVGNLETDIEAGRYWVLEVNGSRQMASPHASVLHDGDIVVWEYVDKAYKPTEHKEWSTY